MPHDAKKQQQQQKTVRHEATAKGAIHIEHILFKIVRCRVV